MLQSMRELAHSWVFKGLMLLLVVSFGIWGIGDMFRGNPLRQVAAKAGDETITAQELNRGFEQTLAHARELLGPDLTAQQAKQMGMVNAALSDLIENSLFIQNLKRLGIEADDRAVFQILMQEPRLRDKDGKFDKNILRGMLANARMSENDFLNQQRKEIAARLLADAFTTIPPTASTMVDDLYKARGQKHVFDIVTVSNANMKISDTPDEKTLRDYYAAHPQFFTVPESRGITIALLAMDSVAKDISISDDQVKKEYDSQGDKLKEPEKRDLLQVVLQDEAKAKTLVTAARSSNLVVAAKPTGHEVIPLNNSEEATMLPEIAKPAFALPLNGISDPIHTALGWHVLQVRKITPPGVPTYDAIKEKLRDSLKANQAADTVTRMVNQLDDELAANHPLEEVADGMKLRLIKIPNLDASGKMPDGKDPAELPHKDDVLKTAFAQNNADVSPVMDDRNGNYFVVRTDSITPASAKPFEQVKDQVLAGWKKLEQEKQATIAAANIAKDMRDGKAATAFASQAGVDVRQSKPISMLGDNDPSISPQILPRLMKLAKGDVETIPADGKQLVVRLASTMPAASTKDDAVIGKITNELNGTLPKELGDQYGKYLHVIYPVTIHQDALDSIALQGG